MSRLAICFFLGVSAATYPLAAQQQAKVDVFRAIAKSKELSAIDRNGCLIDPDDKDAIVVCGSDDENKRHRLRDDGVIDNDRIRPGEAVSGERAAACITAMSVCTRVTGIRVGSFGAVPPPVIPLEEVLRGLPEPDDVVQESSEFGAPEPD
jgi:hypothetical protein